MDSFFYPTLQRLLLTALLVVFLINPAQAKPQPGVAGGLSLVPGLGQLANGNAGEGALWFLSTVGLTFSGNAYLKQIGWDLWQYNMYDAYRDAGAKGATQFNVFENYFATFNPLNIIDPIGAPVVALGAVSGGHASRLNSIPRPLYLRPIIYGFVGLGEEGLFRGFLFPGLSDLFGSKWVGGFVSSVLFAYFHFTNGAQDLAPPVLLQRTLMGAVFCFQTDNNNYDLRKSIFAHAWWDFLVTRSGGVQGRSNSPINGAIDGAMIRAKLYF